MNYRIRWHDDRRTITLCELSDTWTWDDFHAMIREQVVMMSQVSHRVHTIFYSPFEHSTLPEGAVQHLWRLVSMTAPNEDLKIIVDGPPVTRTLFDILRRTYGLKHLLDKFLFVPNLEAAHQAIAAYENARGDRP